MAASPAPGGPGPAGAGRERPGGSGADAAELAELRAQLHEAQETIEAIRRGGVDSLVIGPPGQEQVFAITSADRPYRLIVESMSEGAATVSPHGVILAANPRLGEIASRVPSDLIGTRVSDLVTTGSQAALAQLLAVGTAGHAHGEVELRGPDGTTIPVLLAASGFNLDGMPLHCLVLTDLTELRRVEAEIRTLNAELETRVRQRTAELEQANRSLEAFTYSVSHDLRAPLRAMSGFSTALLEDYGDELDDTGRGYAGRIQEAAERMGELIDDLLQLSRVGRAEMNLTPVDLSAEVAAIAGELQSAEPGRRVRFAIEEGVRVSADRSLIRTVLQNLVENAWKFTARRDDATIEFGTARADDGRVCCYLRDNGAGFDPAYAGKLFRPFQRLHSTSEFPGTGIGLASVHRIIERHGGRTWAEGETGHGATFYFTLGPQDA